MKSLGDTLKDARESRGISMDQAVHETNISRNYLEALENEIFEEFPADAYLVGFLRNYVDFLGLDQEKIIGQFRNYKLSEQPTPIEQLVGPPKGARLRKALPWAAAALALAALGVFVIPPLVKKISSIREEQIQNAASEEPEVPPAREIRPELPFWEGEVRPGDILILEEPAGEKQFTIDASEKRLTLSGSEAENYTLLMGEELFIPGESSKPAWRVYLKDFGLPGGGGIIEVHLQENLQQEDGLDEEIPQSAPPSGEAERLRDSRVILSAAKPERYTLNVAFRDYALVRYKVDNQEPRQAFYANGENLRLETERILTLWISDAGAMYARISGNDVPLGGSGEVSVYQLRWVLNEDTGKYDLTALPLY